MAVDPYGAVIDGEERKRGAEAERGFGLGLVNQKF
jgi:hypothetical protein